MDTLTVAEYTVRVTPGINSLGCPLEVLPVQGWGRRVYQLSLIIWYFMVPK